jgi:hypothetical protein
MPGATLAGPGARERRRFADEPWPQRDFGTRAVSRNRSREAMLAVMGARSVDCGVADMRRRIDASHPAAAGRLAWAIVGAAIGGASLALWLDKFPGATTLAHVLARLF